MRVERVASPSASPVPHADPYTTDRAQQSTRHLTTTPTGTHTVVHETLPPDTLTAQEGATRGGPAGHPMAICRSDTDNPCCTPPAVHRPTKDIQVMSTTESSKRASSSTDSQKLNSCQPPQSTASQTEHRHTCHDGRLPDTIKRHPSCVEVSAHQRTHEGGKRERGQRGRLANQNKVQQR